MFQDSHISFCSMHTKHTAIGEGCVSMGLENRPILKGLDYDNSDPY